MEPHNVYLEIAQKRIIAGAVDWPGWCRGGRDEASALQALAAYGPRYAAVLQRQRIPFQPPSDVSELLVIERLPGTGTTDFGAPDVPPAVDAQPVDEAELARFQSLFKAGWLALDAAIEAAAGKELKKGPRGGGRDLDKIIEHVVDVEAAYLARIGGSAPKPDGRDLYSRMSLSRQAVLDALDSAVRHGVPQGPRGGARWLPRYFVRRTLWHILDHAWEIEDRILI